MAYTAGKPKASTSWLPTQVDYGMDCSDADPKNWKPFGKHAEALAAQNANKPKASPPAPG